MGFDQLTPDAQAFAQRVIRKKARQLAGNDSFTPSDREDIAQELWLDALKRLAKFDPAKGTIFAFLVTVVERQSLSLLRRQSAAKRDACRCKSLNLSTHCGDGAGSDRAANLVQSAADWRLGVESCPPQHHVEVSHDVELTVAQMPPELRELCQRLPWRTVTDVAQEVGLSRSAIYARIKKVRKQFAEAGLREYL